MVFCNKNVLTNTDVLDVCHNPYFNRWFSAILSDVNIKLNHNSHNPYFNRWFSAMNMAFMNL